MFILGHLGVGSKIVSPWTEGLPRRFVLLGTLLPDLIDKPLYMVLSAVTGKRSAELGLISGMRTFGHTAIFLIALTLFALARKSKVFAALALGVATHLFLDNFSDRFTTGAPSALMAMLWPLFDGKFAATTFEGNFWTHFFRPITVGGEVFGLAFLAWDEWKLRHEGEILGITRDRRIFLKRGKKTRKKRGSH